MFLAKQAQQVLHNKSGMVAYQGGGIVTGGVSIVIILLCVTNITSDIHLNNAT